jgi:hypothetical protein
MNNEETKTIKQEVDARGGSLLADIHSNYSRLEHTEYMNESCVFAINNDGEQSGIVMCGSGALIRQTLLHLCSADEDLRSLVMDVAKILAIKSIAKDLRDIIGDDKPEEKSSDDAG